jgi:hypothetical protein
MILSKQVRLLLQVPPNGRPLRGMQAERPQLAHGPWNTKQGHQAMGPQDHGIRQHKRQLPVPQHTAQESRRNFRSGVLPAVSCAHGNASLSEYYSSLYI